MSYIPNTDADREKMLAAIGVASIDDLFQPIPESLRFQGELAIPERLDQIALGRYASRLAARNADAVGMPCFMGAGIYDHYVPPTVAAITGRSEFYTLHVLHSLSAGSQPGSASVDLRVPDPDLRAHRHGRR
jgi:glycine dehydrogenase subunit 1